MFAARVRMNRRVPLAGALVLGMAVSGFAGGHEIQSSRRPSSGKAASQFDRFQVPAASALLLKLRTSLDSASASVDDQVEATLWSPVIQEGVELIPAGSVVRGNIVAVVRASEQTPIGAITFAFSIIEHGETGSRETLSTRRILMEAPREPDAGRGRRKKRQKPVDAVIPSDTLFVATTAEPLVVLIPR